MLLFRPAPRGQKGGRSAPTVINRAYSLAQFWDARAPTQKKDLVEFLKALAGAPISLAVPSSFSQ